MAKPAKGLMPGNASPADDEDAPLLAQRKMVDSRSFVIPKGAPATEDDLVNHPSHYTQGEIECIDAIDSAVMFVPPDEAVCVANVIKYVWRYRCKDPVESLKKARWYLNRLINKVRTRYMDNVDVQHRV